MAFEWRAAGPKPVNINQGAPMAALARERITATGAKALPVRSGQPAKPSGKLVYPARPVQGTIDFAAMRKSVMRKFPKTLAYLAK
jgi:hypothetical protein